MEVKSCIKSRLSRCSSQTHVKIKKGTRGSEEEDRAQNLNSNDQMRVTLDINIHSRTW